MKSLSILLMTILLSACVGGTKNHMTKSDEDYHGSDCREAVMYFVTFVRDDWLTLERHWTGSISYDDLIQGADTDWKKTQSEMLEGIDKYAVYSVAEFFADGHEMFGYECMRKLFSRKAQNHVVYHYPILEEMDKTAGTRFMELIPRLYSSQ